MEAPHPGRLFWWVTPQPLCEWPQAERPRERLRALGPESLSLRELLILLVGSGRSGASAVSVAEQLLEESQGSLRRLSVMSVASLETLPGVGAATASRIAAALEVGRRCAVEAVDLKGRIRGPADVFARMGPRLGHLAQEEFHALLLSTQHRVLREVAITRGILDASLIHPREVFRPAIHEGAAGVILVHNHPSGDPTPSPEDRAVTKQLTEAGKVLGVPVLDHVVVATGGFRSIVGAG